MGIDLNLADEEQVTTTGLNMRSGPGTGYKVVVTLPKFTILWPQQKVPSWVNGKPLNQEGKVVDWVQFGVLTPLGQEEKTGKVTGHCWVGTETSPTFVSTPTFAQT
jgi:hypothetical protein